jgi:beta-galactosidase
VGFDISNKPFCFSKRILNYVQFRILIKSILLYIPMMLNLVCANAQSGASRNDHIFPAAAQAKPYIDYNSKGFLINGKSTFIVSAGIEYARVPRALWRDRLLL